MFSLWEEYLKVSGWESCYSSVNKLLKYLRYRKIGSEASRCLYCAKVYHFCRDTGILPDDLVRLEKAEVERLIEEYCYAKLEKDWNSPRTANTTLFSLKTFFKVNGFRGENRLDIDCFQQSVRNE